jgi:DNA-directed RNA polymerase alpha subunit
MRRKISLKGMSQEQIDEMHLDACGVSNRLLNCLNREGLYYVSDVAAVPEEHLRSIKGLGKTTFAELEKALADMKVGIGLLRDPKNRKLWVRMKNIDLDVLPIDLSDRFSLFCELVQPRD